MTERTFDMDNDDWDRITDIVKSAVEPINTRLDNLPCNGHSESLTKIETQHDMEKEQKAEGKDSRDWILRVAVGVVGLLVFLDKIGVFNGLQK